MKVNILVDFKENGLDKNEPHIVIGAENETAAAVMLKAALECKGYVVQAMCVVDGEYTLDELTDMIYTGEIIDSKTVAGILAYKDSLGRTSA